MPRCFLPPPPPPQPFNPCLFFPSPPPHTAPPFCDKPPPPTPPPLNPTPTFFDLQRNPGTPNRSRSFFSFGWRAARVFFFSFRDFPLSFRDFPLSFRDFPLSFPHRLPPLARCGSARGERERERMCWCVCVCVCDPPPFEDQKPRSRRENQNHACSAPRALAVVVSHPLSLPLALPVSRLPKKKPPITTTMAAAVQAFTDFMVGPNGYGACGGRGGATTPRAAEGSRGASAEKCGGPAPSLAPLPPRLPRQRVRASWGVRPGAAAGGGRVGCGEGPRPSSRQTRGEALPPPSPRGGGGVRAPRSPPPPAARRRHHGCLVVPGGARAACCAANRRGRREGAPSRRFKTVAAAPLPHVSNHPNTQPSHRPSVPSPSLQTPASRTGPSPTGSLRPPSPPLVSGNRVFRGVGNKFSGRDELFGPRH